MKQNNLRVIVAVALLLGTAWLLHAREKFEVVPEHQTLANLPMKIGPWSGADAPIDQATRDVLGPGEFLRRNYSGGDNDPEIDLFIGYFPSQRAGDTMHSPKNCLPGSGWSEVHKALASLSWPNGEKFLANQYRVAKGSEQRLVLYWYLSQGRATPNEYRNKIDLVLNSMRKNRSDGSLIRIVTPVHDGETDEAAMQRLMPFVDALVPKLSAYIPN